MLQVIHVKLHFKMEKEDVSLQVEMEKLVIEPIKLNSTINDDNPFVTLAHTPNNYIKQEIITCSCVTLKNINKNVPIRKKKCKKILKEPILKFIKTEIKDNINIALNRERISKLNKICPCNCSAINNNLESGNLRTLVDNCNQLKISSNDEEPRMNVEKNTWWKKEPCMINSPALDKNLTSPSCSQQALNPPCDVTIDELASYFETLVHIPKKMSSMAEMMYI